MSTSQRGKTQIETSRVLSDFAAMVDSGDQTIFTKGSVWSMKSGFEAEVLPDGIASGRNLVSPGAAADQVAVAAFTCFLAGVEESIVADPIFDITRPATAVAKVCSVTVTSAGVLAEVAGTDAADAIILETRGAAGGPPFIPVGSIEIAQIRMVDDTAAIFTAAEIFQDVGSHAEYYDSPSFEINPLGEGSNAGVAAKTNAFVEFASALPTSHTASVPKGVSIKYYTPTLATLPKTIDFVPADKGVTKSSEAYYEGAGGSGAIGSMKADSVGDVSFTVMAGDGITDPILAEDGDMVTVKFFPDANKAPYILSQGMLGVARTFPTGEQNKINATVYCASPSVGFAS